VNQTFQIMNRLRQQYSPDPANEAGASADEHAIDAPQSAGITSEESSLDAERLTRTKAEAKDEGGDQANAREGDSTILGAGGLAGGLSGDGERTDEYDAAVMGLDD
jgi:hypothetical protein